MSNIRLLATQIQAKLEAITDKPVAAVTYALIKLATDLRSIGSNPVIADQINTSDSVSFEIIKNLADAVLVLDEAAVSDGKIESAYADNVGLLEAVQIVMDWLREPSDSAAAVDQIEKLVTKEFADSVTAIDQLIDATISQLVQPGDSTGVSDQATLSFTKSIDEPVSAVDSRSMDFIKALSDQPSAIDQAAIAFVKALQESVSTQETFAFDIYKYFQGADSASVSDVSVIDFIKSATDSASVSDQKFLEFIKGLTETLTAGDSGQVFSTSYADITYFAEDYVGESRTF